jgi:hypothetical protein
VDGDRRVIRSEMINDEPESALEIAGPMQSGSVESLFGRLATWSTRSRGKVRLVLRDKQIPSRGLSGWIAAIPVDETVKRKLEDGCQ